MNSNLNNGASANSPENAGRKRRKLKTKPLMYLLLILFVGNLLWFVAWLIPNGPDGNEVVASVSGEEVTREEWMAAMEEQHGRDALLDLVNKKVMDVAAKEYGIEVSDKEIDLELAMLRSAQDGTEETLHSIDKNQMREKVQAQLILEKVLTKDILVEDSEVKKFYEENQSIYDIKDAYRTRKIVVNSKEEAESVISELDNGTSFEALARERSIDTATGSLGGDIGYVTPNQSSVGPAIEDAVSSVGIGDWSEPLSIEGGRFAVISVDEKVEGRTFSFEEVADHIGRELALEQLPQSVAPEAFWREFDAVWFYGE